METTKRLNLINDLFVSSDNIEYDEESIKINIKALDASKIELLKLLNEDSVATEYIVNGIENDDFSILEEGNQIVLCLDASYLRTKEQYSFYNKVDDFLNKNRISLSADSFYINEINLSHKSFEKEKFYKYYSSLIALQKIVNNISVDILEDTSTLDVKYIVFDRIKLIIHSEYLYQDIVDAYEKENFISIITQLQEETILKSDKRTNSLFLINAFENIFSKQKEIKMSLVMQKLQNIYEEYQVHHRAYVNSLEPEKIKDDYEKNIQEYLGKLNTLLSDVNNKMIFLPIAFIVSLGQLSSAAQEKNIVILFGMLVFCLLIYKFSKTQQEVLYAIKEDIKEKEESFKEDTPKIFKEIEPKIVRLNKLVCAVDDRFKWTTRLTWLVFGVVVLAVVYYYGLTECGTFDLLHENNCTKS